jgi:hypothetical protein
MINPDIPIFVFLSFFKSWGKFRRWGRTHQRMFPRPALLSG